MLNVVHNFTCRFYKMSNSLSLRSILDANKLTGPNYTDWLRKLRIVLTAEKLSYILNSPIPASVAATASEEEIATFKKWQDDASVVQCIMLASMSNELQRQHEKMDAHSILLHLQELYGEQSRSVRYEISKELFRSLMTGALPYRLMSLR